MGAVITGVGAEIGASTFSMPGPQGSQSGAKSWSGVPFPLGAVRGGSISVVFDIL